MPNIRIPSVDELPKFYVLCTICNKKIEQVGFPNPYIAEVCDECKEAIKFAKELRNGYLNNKNGEIEFNAKELWKKLLGTD